MLQKFFCCSQDLPKPVEGAPPFLWLGPAHKVKPRPHPWEEAPPTPRKASHPRLGSDPLSHLKSVICCQAADSLRPKTKAGGRRQGEASRCSDRRWGGASPTSGVLQLRGNQARQDRPRTQHRAETSKGAASPVRLAQPSTVGQEARFFRRVLEQRRRQKHIF